MAYSVGNVQKFFAEHPEIDSETAEEVMTHVLRHAEDGIVEGGFLESIMGSHIAQFRREYDGSREHPRLAAIALTS